MNQAKRKCIKLQPELLEVFHQQAKAVGYKRTTHFIKAIAEADTKALKQILS